MFKRRKREKKETADEKIFDAAYCDVLFMYAAVCRIHGKEGRQIKETVKFPAEMEKEEVKKEGKRK